LVPDWYPAGNGLGPVLIELMEGEAEHLELGVAADDDAGDA
jgi:hypothetical protein